MFVNLTRNWILVCLVGLITCGCTASPGRKVYLESGCARCHGGGLSGTQLGPSLKDLRQNWGKDELRKFLKSPNRYKKQNERLQRIAARFRVPMPAFSMDDSSRGRLADYLLEQSK